jgi:hypothetical protein
MEFSYTLMRNEYLDYCKYEIYRDPNTLKLKHRGWLLLPVIFAILLVALRPSNPVYYIVAVVASLLWMLLINYRVAQIIVKGANDKAAKAPDEAFCPIHLKLCKGYLEINGKRCTLNNYHFFSDLLIMQMENLSMVILPSRVFGSSEEQVRELTDALKRCR